MPIVRILTAADDDVTFGDDDDLVHALEGNDIVKTGNGHNIVYGSAGNDTIIGGDDADLLDGGDDDDVVSGGAGDDILYGGAGIDTLSGDDGNDQIDGGEGGDKIAIVKPSAAIRSSSGETATSPFSWVQSVPNAFLPFEARPSVAYVLSLFGDLFATQRDALRSALDSTVTAQSLP